MLFRVVRAGLRRGHPSTSAAVESVIEEEWRDGQFLRLKLVKDMMGIVGTIIVTYAGVIPTDDKVRATVVLTD